MAATLWVHVLSDEGAPTRAAAARAVVAVRQGRNLDAALNESREQFSPTDQALIAAMAHGVLREYRYLAALADPLLRRPPKEAVHALVLVGLFQLRSMRVPVHAALHATVGATPLLGQPKARGMVNAVLRRFQRERDQLETQVPKAAGIRQSHPDWLVDQLHADWPDAWESLLDANNQPAPMTLRVNRRRADRDTYIRELENADIEAEPHPLAPDAVVLKQPMSVHALPGFDEGSVSVQDAAAQLAAPLLDIRAGMRVLDACAAPGGKTTHCLELADCHVTALDNDPERLKTVADNLQRCQFPVAGSTERKDEGVVLQCADAGQTDAWWDGRAFDRILIDAPCSGTGVIRRHPDIKWLRRESDVPALAKRQRALLDALWPLLSPGGMLVYATCSVLRAEGTDVTAGFLEATVDAHVQSMPSMPGSTESVGCRIAPGQDGMDGFYYAAFTKRG